APVDLIGERGRLIDGRGVCGGEREGPVLAGDAVGGAADGRGRCHVVHRHAQGAGAHVGPIGDAYTGGVDAVVGVDVRRLGAGPAAAVAEIPLIGEWVAV